MDVIKDENSLPGAEKLKEALHRLSAPRPPRRLFPKLAEHVGEWVVLRPGAGERPAKLSGEECDLLALALMKTLADRIVREKSGWSDLERMTKGWKIQKERGAAPRFIGAAEYRQLLLLALNALAEAPETGGEEEPPLPPGYVRWPFEEPPPEDILGDLFAADRLCIVRDYFKSALPA